MRLDPQLDPAVPKSRWLRRTITNLIDNRRLNDLRFDCSLIERTSPRAFPFELEFIPFPEIEKAADGVVETASFHKLVSLPWGVPVRRLLRIAMWPSCRFFRQAHTGPQPNTIQCSRSLAIGAEDSKIATSA